VHDYYQHTLSDLPVFQTSSVIIIQSRKFKCKNAKCCCKVFLEQSPNFLRYVRRTQRASEIFDSLSIELTGKPGSILSEKFCIKVSTSTITRIAHKQSLPTIKQPRVLGVDDWAYRKGVSYGTVLIDMETFKPIDILESRDGADLKEWLRNHKGVEIVTRDRASSYSSAIDEVCPKAIHVADRFHLLMNLSDALDKYFKSINPKINELIKGKTNEILSDSIDNSTCNAIEKEQVTSDKDCLCEDKFDQRLVIFNKVKELQKQNIAIKKISRELVISCVTVRSYSQYNSLPARFYHKSTNIDLYTNHIISRLNSKGCLVKDIIDEIKKLGYNGGQTQAYQNIKIIKEKYKLTVPGFSKLQKVKVLFVKP
jgi:hypothetical protein